MLITIMYTNKKYHLHSNFSKAHCDAKINTGKPWRLLCQSHKNCYIWFTFPLQFPQFSSLL